MITIDEKLRILQPLLGTRKVLGLRSLYYMKTDSRDKRRIENKIDGMISRLAKKGIEEEIILPPPKKDICGGDIDIGKVEYLHRELYPFELKLKDINRHMGIFGSTGSGKTTFARNLIHNLHDRNIPFLIIDWETSYRNLVKELDGVRVFTVGTDINPFFLNFLTVPPGIEVGEYIKSVIAIISADYIGGIGADTMLLNYMELAYEETKHPCFSDLKDIVAREIQKDKKGKGKLGGRSGLWKESVARQITFMSKGAAGNINNSRKHYPLDKLFSRPVVLEFGGIKSPHDRKFFIHIILNWLSLYSQHRGIKSEDLKQAIILEEFHNIAMRGNEDNMVSNLFCEIRKYGIGLIAIDQVPSNIPNTIYANMNAKVSFTLNTSQDITGMAKAINLDFHKSKFLGMLETGQAIVNVKQRCQDPFLIKGYYKDIKENMKDAELRELMKPYKDEHLTISDLNANQGSSNSSQSIDTLSPQEKILLANVVEHPLIGMDKRAKILGLHSSEMAQIHGSLEDKEIISTATVDRKKLIELTDKGRQFARDEGFKLENKKSRGGIEHFYWVSQVCRMLGKHEFSPIKELFDIDITDIKKGLAIEIETGKSDIKKNLIKLNNLYDLKKPDNLNESRFKACFMLSTTRPVEFKIKEIFQTTINENPALESSLKNIRIMFISDFLKLTKDQIIP